MTLKKCVGTKHGVSIEVAAWDGVEADVSLSCVAMFSSEVDDASPKGGLAHLDKILGGELLALRKDGYFDARPEEIALIGTPPTPVAADALLIVGLGDPLNSTRSVLANAVSAAAQMALGLQVRSAAFAPSMLDSGLVPAQTHNAPAHMVEGLMAALNQNARLRQLGLAANLAIEQWVFDVGAPRFEQAVEQFQAALERH